MSFFQRNNQYLLGTDVLIGAVSQVVIPPAPGVYSSPVEVDDDADDIAHEIEHVLGLRAPGRCVGCHRLTVGHVGHGGPGWPQGNWVWPGVDIDHVLARLASGEPEPDMEIAGAPQPQHVKLWEGTDEDLINQLDLARRWDEGFDEAMVRRTGKMRG